MDEKLEEGDGGYFSQILARRDNQCDGWKKNFIGKKSKTNQLEQQEESVLMCFACPDPLLLKMDGADASGTASLLAVGVGTAKAGRVEEMDSASLSSSGLLQL